MTDIRNWRCWFLAALLFIGIIALFPPPDNDPHWWFDLIAGKTIALAAFYTLRRATHHWEASGEIKKYKQNH